MVFSGVFFVVEFLDISRLLSGGRVLAKGKQTDADRMKRDAQWVGNLAGNEEREVNVRTLKVFDQVTAVGLT
jgi:hypothetical protein